MQSRLVSAQKVRRPNDGVENLHNECGEELYAEVGTALALRDNSIRTSVRKVSGATDKAAACRQGHTGPVLILLPPSEKKAAEPAPAIELYTGVLYAALGWSTLSKAQQKLAQSSIMIISARYGALRPLDPTEPYKEKIVNKEMAPKVAAVLDAITTELIIDCRSSTYQTVWQSPIEKTVEVKVFTKVDGEKKVITHMSKKTRGEVTRQILISGEEIKTPHQLHEALSKEFTCNLIAATAKEPWVLEVYC